MEVKNREAMEDNGGRKRQRGGLNAQTADFKGGHHIHYQRNQRAYGKQKALTHIKLTAAFHSESDHDGHR